MDSHPVAEQHQSKGVQGRLGSQLCDLGQLGVSVCERIRERQPHEAIVRMK